MLLLISHFRGANGNNLFLLRIDPRVPARVRIRLESAVDRITAHE